MRISGRRSRAAWVALALLLAVSFCLRLVPVVIYPSLNWGDEVFQATEQAHRLVYGNGLVPWEFQVGMRSWLLPGVITAIMAAARAVASGPAVYLPAIACAFGLLAAAPAVCAFLWCRARLGPWLALLAALVPATAPELIYYGDRTLAEVTAGHLLIIGVYLLLGAESAAAARRLTAGAILGAVLALRIQMLPVVLVLLAIPAINGRTLRARIAAACGAVAVLLASGVLDYVTLGAPFASITRYVFYNAFTGASASFGVAPFYYYGIVELALWGPAIVVPVGLCVAGRRISVTPAACALIIIAAHSVIAHKEQRFIYPALVLLSVQAGFGLAVTAQWLAARVRQDFPRLASPAILAGIAAAGVWCTVAAATWNGQAMKMLRHRVHDDIAASDYVGRLKGVCGIGLVGAGASSWAMYGGYTHLHLPVPLYWPGKTGKIPAGAGAYNVLLADGEPPPPGFGLDLCFGTACVYRRPGNCDNAPMAALPFPE